MKRIIIYYSHDGNTKLYAERIGEALSLDLIQIEPIHPIKAKGFFKIMQGGAQVTFGIKPKIRPIDTDFKEYDEIILGTPIWAGRPASPTQSFLKNFEYKDKITSVFTLSGSGNNSKCIKFLKKKCPNIKLDVSLLDKNNEESISNDQVLEAFLKQFTK